MGKASLGSHGRSRNYSHQAQLISGIHREHMTICMEVRCFQTGTSAPCSSGPPHVSVAHKGHTAGFLLLAADLIKLGFPVRGGLQKRELSIGVPTRCWDPFCRGRERGAMVLWPFMSSSHAGLGGLITLYFQLPCNLFARFVSSPRTENIGTVPQLM